MFFLNFACRLAVAWKKWHIHKAPTVIPFEVKQDFLRMSRGPDFEMRPFAEGVTASLSRNGFFRGISCVRGPVFVFDPDTEG
ncbi:MAG: hypothetical protein ONB48_13485 [candidate division KSB1 bacterium]|nr:hypothetical protein [candidate division KSB1 bacterium]MDZ7274887.1 hypothetical protein [candidate division KSB1 bacterium]MDZ7286661.1 hypothetical protein [candidate division KSB1 bacterium]MDZ7299176.1 hypothetical protein [candidate division KSB1 bacterium]MDZ7307014.1 hypothetical protein [candidate division KSB1 bacterium]